MEMEYADNEICVPGKSREVSQDRAPHPPSARGCSREAGHAEAPPPGPHSDSTHPTSFPVMRTHFSLPPGHPASSSFVHLTQTAWPTFHYERQATFLFSETRYFQDKN